MTDRKQNAAIGCDAENCEFNEHGSACSAKHIKVDGKTAHTTDGTRCSTFRAKGGRA